MEEKTICTLLVESLHKYEQREMVYDVMQGETFTYDEFNKLVNEISKGLIYEGIEKGNHIGLLEDNSVYWFAILCAICNVGAVAVLLNSALSSDEILYAINYADISMLFTSTEICNHFKLKESNPTYKIIYMDRQEPEENLFTLLNLAKFVSDNTLSEYIQNVKGEDVATLQFTSGTTGRAKAVLTSHESLYINAKDTARELEYTEQDSVVLGTPMFHILGYIGTALTVYSVGASLCVVGKYSTSKVLRVIQEKKCTSFHGVPTMYQLLMEKCKDYDISTLKKGLIAGASVTGRIISKCFETLGLEHMVNIYGQTETLSIGTIHYRNAEDFENTNFTLRDGIVAKVFDIHNETEEVVGVIGELMVKTDNAMLGYYKNEEATEKTKDGKWIRTGDLSVLNEDGTIRVKGRRGDIIIRGGENILVTELERKFLNHPLIQNVAVFGVSDKLYGEEIAAFIEQNVDEPITKSELEEYVDKYFSKIERPKFLRIVKNLPLNTIGKINKLSLSAAI